YGVNVQVLADLRGVLLWVSAALPGSTNDITAARTHDILTTIEHTGLTILADKGYHGGKHTLATPHRKPYKSELTDEQRQINRTHGRLRGPGERANATLKNWRILRHHHYHPHLLTTLIWAIFTLTQTG
ncbi:IS5/IS1182 family transposase, partial [Pseudonocardiaceae bacterium YIM PH 21723]